MIFYKQLATAWQQLLTAAGADFAAYPEQHVSYLAICWDDTSTEADVRSRTPRLLMVHVSEYR